MSAQANFDLSGRWTGMYNYPGPIPPIAFEAELQDLAGCISGSISESDEPSHDSGGSLGSIVEGLRAGSAVTFTKLYDDAERRPEPVFYSGTLQPDGNEISGLWEIPGHWSGTFLMVRSPGLAEAVEEEAGEEMKL